MESLDDMRILQVSTADIAGGAESVAWQLFQGYRCRGYDSWLAVGLKRSSDPDVLLIQHPKPRCLWPRLCRAASDKLSPWVGRVKGAGKAQRMLQNLSEPYRWLKRELGHEDFYFPGTWHLLDLPPKKPDVIQCHNFHGPIVPGGGYFDLRALPWLSHQVPTVLTLHDAWLLSGHCAHSFDCERWKTGCGHCPDLTIYPAIKRDTTAYNWRRKQDIYARSHLYVATPSRWLMYKVEQSILAPAIVEARVIPNGVDLAVFHSGDRQKARAALDIPRDAKMLLFVGNTIRSNQWKDYTTVETALKYIAERLSDKRLILVCLGEKRESERIGQAEVRFIGYQKDSATVAMFYQATDIYLHAAKADTFPNTVLEALACGRPVVATAVGGIPEQVKDGITGFLVPPADVEAMTKAVIKLLVDGDLKMRMGHNAAEDARRRFDLNRQVDDYINWYREILEKWQREEKSQ